MAHLPTSRSEFSISKVPRTLNLPTSRSTASLFELLSAPDAPSAEGVFMMKPRLPERNGSRFLASCGPAAGTRSPSVAPPPFAALPSFPSEISMPGLLSASTSIESTLSLMTITTPNLMNGPASHPSIIYTQPRIHTSVQPQQVDPLSFARSAPVPHPSHYHPYDRAKITRAKTACIPCRGSKTKCLAQKIGEQPCGPCVEKGKVCIWPGAKEKRSGTRKSFKDKSGTPSVDQVSQPSTEPTPAISSMPTPISHHLDASLPGQSFCTSSVFEQPHQTPASSIHAFQPSYSISEDRYTEWMGRYGASGLEPPPIRGVMLAPIEDLERTQGQGPSGTYLHISTKPPTTDSLLPPILANLSSTPPNPYSAHQKALTTTARLAAAKHHDIAIEICFTVARELLKLGEPGSGVELAVRGLGYMVDSELDVDDKTRASVTQLLALTPPIGPWRKKLADAAIKWSASEGECPSGDPGLHQYIGELYYKDHSYVLAEQHLLASGKRDAANMLAEMMFDWCGKGEQDPGPYAAKGVLPFLAQIPPNILPAQTFLSRFLSLLSPTSSILSVSGSDSDIMITPSPTLNFLQMAILTCQRAPAPGVSGIQARGTDGGIGREWEGLVSRYRRVSGRQGVLAQKEILEVLDQISKVVFLIPQRGGGQGDMLQNLMGSLFGGGGGGGNALTGRR